VTEADWLAGTDPAPMLDYLRDRVGDRQLRLFVVDCCWRVWPQLQDERSRRAVIVSERYADGLADKKELARARKEARTAGWNAAAARARQVSWNGPAFIAWCSTRETIASAAKESARSCAWHATAKRTDLLSRFPAWEVGDLDGERRRQVAVLHCIVGNPFRAARIDPAWLVWNESVALKLVRGVDEERAFDRLPILADALEDAGCDNADILAHCRGPGPHVRGCWVVDLLLGKE
jgi:hypothetical protein